MFEKISEICNILIARERIDGIDSVLCTVNCCFTNVFVFPLDDFIVVVIQEV
jgi:hypothetical protein